MRSTARAPGGPVPALPALLLPVLPALLLPVLAWGQAPPVSGVRLEPTDELTPAYEATVDERDAETGRQALESGESWLPTLHGGPAPDPVSAPPLPVAVPPPVAAPPPRLDPGRPATPPPTRYAVPARPARAQPPALLQELLEGWRRPPEIRRVAWPAPVPAADRAPGPVAAAPPGGVPAARSPVAAGTGLYARILYSVNSDYPGPVVAELLEPPLAGAVVTGAFEQVRSRLVLRFDRLEHGGRATAVDAWGVGLDCACYGVAGTVDRHWFERVVLPAAVSFGEGFLRLASLPDETVTLSGGTVYASRDNDSRAAIRGGLAEAAQAVGEVLAEDAPRRRTVSIAAGAELLVMFVAAAAASPAASPAAPPAAAAGAVGAAAYGTADGG